MPVVPVPADFIKAVNEVCLWHKTATNFTQNYEFTYNIYELMALLLKKPQKITVWVRSLALSKV